MSARDALMRVPLLVARHGGQGKRADAILSALRAMPEAERLAFARELAGPGFAVVPIHLNDTLRHAWDAVPVSRIEAARGWRAGIAACDPVARRVMLAEWEAWLREDEAATQKPTP